MKEQLEKHLFREGRYTYAVLDGASIVGLPQKLFELDPIHKCLYRGELSDEMIHVAPYLVHLQAGSLFTDWLFTECWGKNWGIFAQSPQSPAGVHKHFRTLLIANDDAGNPLLFRFYDPRVLLPFLLTCEIGQIETIFGPVDYYFAESFDHAELCRLHIRSGSLVETRLKFGAVTN